MPSRRTIGPRRALRLLPCARTPRRAAAFCLGLACVAFALWPACLLAGPDLARSFGQASCSRLRISADVAECTPEACVLDGHALLQCDGRTQLTADHLEVRLGPAQSFAGAQAQGHVVLVDLGKVLLAQSLVLDADAIRGVIDHATLEVRRPGATIADGDAGGSGPPLAASSGGLPPGRNALVLHGTLERLDRARYRLHDADVTLCDCGPGCLPSWRFDAPRIDVTLDARALIFWPRLRINVANRWLVPITPPLLPLSLPLTPRAPGFLPPQVSFLQLPYPTADLPLFVPLGPAWDLTFAPGVRTDWGAPRLGARLRYAPTAQTFGRVRAQFTHDGRGQMAQGYQKRELSRQPSLAADAAFVAEYEARAALTERVSLDWEHVSRLPYGAAAFDILTHGAWVSDDLVHRDLLISPEQRVAAYLPSRGALVLRHPDFIASLAVDGLLRLDNAPNRAPSGKVKRDYSNLRGAEARTLHRAPALQVQLVPLLLGLGLQADLEASFIRYGRLTPSVPQTPLELGQTIWGSVLGLGFGRHVGPFDVHARAAVDAVLVQPEGGRAFADAAPLTEADVGLRLARRFGNLVHVVHPHLAYRGVDKRYAAGGPVARAAQGALDVRMLRRQSQQALLIIEQNLWSATQLPHTGAPPKLGLDVGQPVDLRTGDALQPFVELRLDTSHVGQGQARISLDPHRLGTKSVRELTAQYNIGVGPWHLALAYSRMAPDADRFQRSIYELAAPRGLIEPQSRSDWAHLLRGSAEVRINRALHVHYTTLYQLPQPEAPKGYIASACTPAGSTKGPTHCFVSHVVRLSYTSPCDCWGFESVLSGAPQDLLGTLRFQVLLNVAGTTLGGA